jgi:glycosyltransferase involved in cell wall biosynthesis
MSNVTSSNATFYKYLGNYGGDHYEDWLFDLLSQKNSIQKIQEPRLGGVRSLVSLLKLVKSAYIRRGKAIRPLGLPIYLPGMIVVFHHFDHTDLPWYSRLLENIDILLLRILYKFFNVKVISVSEFWQTWLENKNIPSEYLIYNSVSVESFSSSQDQRKYLASKYGLNQDLKWIFLGGDQKKKGGDAILEAATLRSDLTIDDYQFIFSGKNTGNINDSKKIIWLEREDYFAFLGQQHLVIANSLFSEGWCRVVHEALLCGAPTVGSGKGGMAELLSSGGGRICSIDEMIDSILTPPIVDTIKIKKFTQKICISNNREIRKVIQYLNQ